jgi:hypothetical protein
MSEKNKVIHQILEIIKNNPSITTSGIQRYLKESSTVLLRELIKKSNGDEWFSDNFGPLFKEKDFLECCYEVDGNWNLTEKGIEFLSRNEVLFSEKTNSPKEIKLEHSSNASGHDAWDGIDTWGENDSWKSLKSLEETSNDVPTKAKFNVDISEELLEDNNKKYRILDYPYMELKSNITMPKFQRSLVWDDERKNKFITSVLKGNPFGFMLIYQDEKTQKNQIIDGLQRFTTLNQYEKDPISIIKLYMNNIPTLSLIKKIIHQTLKNLSIDSIEDSIMSKFNESLNKRTLIEITESLSVYQTFFNKVKRIFPEIEKQKSEYDIELLLEQLKDEVTSYLDIKKLLIPVIMYKGNKDELPEIFERLNTGGATLTKYEVFASTWSDVILSNIHLDIAKKIEARYKDVIKQTSLSIENYNEGDIISFRKVSLYEYCFALGKLIKETAPKLFGATQSKDDKVDSIGFSVLVVFSRMQYKNMMQLHELINGNVNFRNLQLFTEAIIETFKELQTVLVKFTMNYSNYIEGQIISMAYDLFRINYDIDIPSYKIKENTYRKDLLKKFYQHAPFRYFFDMTRNYWSGSGDSKLYDFASAPIEKSKYVFEIDDNVWRIQLRNWLIDLKEKQSKTIPKDVKTFIAFIHAPYIKEKDHNQLMMTWIIPKATLKTKQIMFGTSHPGNLYLIHKELVEFQSNLINKALLKQKQIDLLPHYPNFEQLKFITSIYARDEYAVYLDERIDYLVDVFLSIKKGY